MGKVATLEYDNPDAGELLVDAVSTFEIATEIKINSPAMYDLAADQLREVKTAIRTHTERRLGITRKMDDLKKDVTSLFTPALNKLEEAKVFLERAMLHYNAEQERLRAAEQKRLDDIARVERERLEAEARKVEQAAAKLIAEAKGKKQKEEAAAAQQRAAEEAEALRQTSAVVVAATSVVAAPKAAGTNTTETWIGECTDLLATVKFVAVHPEYLNLVTLDQTALNALARSQHENMKVDGCVAKKKFGITSRGSK